MGITTNFKLNGTDIGNILVEKSYMLDRYPELADNLKQSVLWSAGNNYYGSLGNNDASVTRVTSPTSIYGGGTNWKYLAKGTDEASGTYGHMAAIKTDGTLWLWGYNINGQLGDGTTVDKSSPVQISGGGTNWVGVTLTDSSTFAIKTDGTLWSWGNTNNGQLGIGAAGGVRSAPTQIGSSTNWKQVSGGYESGSAIKTDGTLWGWGLNTYGTLGDGNINTIVSTPVQTILTGNNWKQVSCGFYYTMAIKTDGTLWGWGAGGTGQLGNEILANTSTPVQIGTATTWKIIECGRNHSAGIKTDGTLWLWGSNTNGKIGNNSSLTVSTPVQIYGAGTNWKQVSCGKESTVAMKTDGTLWAWGVIQHFYPTATYAILTPVQISADTNWKTISGIGTRYYAILGDLT
jgi:alpha-tubulin suppressor-like RCC1 family protein